MASGWGGRRAQAWRAAVLAEYGDRCWLRLPGCLVTATTADHVQPRSLRPDLAYDVSNGRPACGPCNSRRGARAVARPTVDGRRFFDSLGSRTPRDPFRSLPEAQRESRDPAGSGTLDL